MSEAMAPDTREIMERTGALVAQARALVIADADSYQNAGAFLTGVKALRKEIDATFDPVVRKAHEAHRAACDAKKKHEAPLVEAEGIVKRAISAYVTAEEQRRRQEAAEAAAKARREAEERALAEAAALEAAGEKEQAERVIEEVEMAPPPPPPPPAVKAQGVSTREKWTAEVVDFAALVRAVAAGRAPMALLSVNQSALNKQAEALKGELAYDGVKARMERVVAARASGW